MVRNIAVFLLIALLFALPAAGASPSVDERILVEQVTHAGSRPQKIKACLALARWYESRNDPGKALAVYERAMKERPKRKERYALLLAKGNLLLAEKRYASAIESYQEAAGLLPHLGDAFLRLAQAYRESELYELAKQAYLAVLRKNPRSFEANLGLAALCLEQGLHGQALEFYRTALTLRPEPAIYRKIASCARNSGDTDLAIAMLLQILASERTYEDHVILGRLYEKQKRYREAEESYSQAIKLDPQQMEGYLYLALFYLANDETVPAEELLHIAKEKAPEEGIVHFFLASLYQRQQRDSLARAEIEQAQRLAKSKTLAHYSKKFAGFLSLR